MNPEKGEKTRPVYGVIGVPSRASLKNKQFVMDAAAGVFDSVAIVSEPFTIAYGMNRLTDALVIDIGAGTIDICPIYGVYPADDEQVTVALGGDAVDEEFEKRLKAKFPRVQASRNMLREIKEKHGFVNSVGEQALVNLPVDGKPTPHDVTEPLKAACMALVNPIVDAVPEADRQVRPRVPAAAPQQHHPGRRRQPVEGPRPRDRAGAGRVRRSEGDPRERRDLRRCRRR